MFNKIQQESYHKSFEAITKKLGYYVGKIVATTDNNNISANLNAFYFTLEKTLMLDKDIKSRMMLDEPSSQDLNIIEQGLFLHKIEFKNICEYFFPLDNHQGLRDFFYKLHDLVNARDPHHQFMTNLIDDKLTLSEAEIQKQKLSKMFAETLKLGLLNWLIKKQADKNYLKRDMVIINNRLKSQGIIDAPTSDDNVGAIEKKVVKVTTPPVRKHRNKWAGF